MYRQMSLGIVFTAGGSMRMLICSLILVSSSISLAATRDKQSQFMFDTMTRGQQVLELKGDSERFRGICSLVKSRMAYRSIGHSWLGDFNNLARDQKAVQEFQRLVPSIVIHKVLGSSGGDLSGSWTVDSKSIASGGGRSTVAVSVTTSSGSTYRGKAVLIAAGSSYQIIDFIYLGFSAVGYMGQDFQRQLKEEYNKAPKTSLPVSALIRDIKSQAGFQVCP